MTTCSNTLCTISILAATFCAGAEPLGTNGLKYEEPQHLAGTIYSADRKKALFKFSRVSVRHGNSLTVSRVYTYLDGSPAFKEKVIYDGDKLAEYEIEDPQLGTRGSARIIGLKSEPARSVISFE